MKDKDHIRDLFSEKLGQFESPVRPEVWSGISSQIGTPMIVGGGKVSLIYKVLIGFSVAASLAVTAYILLENNSVKDRRNEPRLNVPKEENYEFKAKSEELDRVSGQINNSKKGISEQVVGALQNESLIPEVKEQSDMVVQAYETKIFEETEKNKYKDETKILSDEEKGEDISVTEHDSGYGMTHTHTQIDSTSYKPTDLNVDLPNTFTPNGDGINDRFFIQGLHGTRLHDFSLIVLDVSNKVVYQTSDNQFEWDGDAPSGEPVPAGNYIYYFTAITDSGKTVTKYSRLTISRNR